MSFDRLRWRFSAWGSYAASMMGTPALSASFFTASMKGRFSYFFTNEMASPLSPQPKQWKNCLAGLMLNDGVFSLWNGQLQTKAEPARLRGK